MKKVLVFFPHNPSPPRTGAHKRCLEIVGGLRDLGCEVSLLSSTLSTDTDWKASSVVELKQLVREVYIYEGTPADHSYTRRLRKAHWLQGRLEGLFGRTRPNAGELPVSSRSFSPPGMRRWFRGLVNQIDPDIIVMNYAHWDKLMDHRRPASAISVIDTIDMVSLNGKMQKAVRESLPVPLRVSDVGNDVLDEEFFDQRGLTVSPAEFRVFDNYDYSIAITAVEAKLIQQHTKRTIVVLIPMTHEPSNIPNSYSGPVVFPVGPNYFNTQGYLYFVKRVLPRVLKAIPSFALHVTGSDDRIIPRDPVAGVVFRGFVPDLAALYQECRFVACPVFGGTGQQVKIVEAMSHGVPVVALRAAAERSPIRHGENGLIADNADEFAENTIRLWNSPELLRRLGQASRETIAREFSRSHLIEGLSQIVGEN
jgi:glycosyltransferase involved in cell wall biosynthesis